MQFAAQHQHRPGLGGIARRGLSELRGIGIGFCNACGAVVDPEDAIGQHAEIAGPGGFDQRCLLDAVLDIEANGAAVIMIHAAIHGEGEGVSV